MMCKTIEESKAALSKVIVELYELRDKAEGKYFESLTIAIETVAGRKRTAADLAELETVETYRRGYA